MSIVTLLEHKSLESKLLSVMNQLTVVENRVKELEDFIKTQPKIVHKDQQLPEFLKND